MKKIISTLAVISILGLVPNGSAMNLDQEQLTVSKVYKPTKSAVKKTMTKMGYEYIVDKDGDLLFKLGKGNWKAYVIFNTLSDGRVWNLQLFVQFSTKENRYDELIEYANKWNATKKYPKVSLRNKDTLKITYNYPIQYGFNPDEFEENVLGIFETAINIIAEETYAMRR